MSKIVSISEAASIAIHVMVLIAKAGNNKINVGKLGDMTGASKNHIAKVMNQLVKMQFVKSTRGPAGGFIMNKPASEISLLQIYESIEGEITIPDCPFDNKICPMNNCIMNGIVHKMTHEIKDYLKNQTLSDLI